MLVQDGFRPYKSSLILDMSIVTLPMQSLVLVGGLVESLLTNIMQTKYCNRKLSLTYNNKEMKIEIELDKMMAVLEHFLSLHEADEISYMITDEDATIEDIKDKLKTI